MQAQQNYRKKYVFGIITIALPLLIIFLLEISLNLANYGNSYDLFVSTPTSESSYLGISFDAIKKYFNKIDDIPSPRKDLFLKKKPDNGFRIFILGGSTAAGFPYGNNLTFSRILNRRLSDTFPDKRIEVVNTAFTAINTYTQLDFMDEIIQHQPDAILIYSGHNEYYGALGVGSMENLGKQPWIIKTILTLKEFKVYQLMENTTESIFGLFSGDVSDKFIKNPTATLMERIVDNKYIPLDSKDYKLGVKQFRSNLGEIIEIAQTAKIKVVLSELVSNIRDQKPFYSINTDDNPCAEDVFNHARNYEHNNELDLAREFYYRAKDLDVLRFRAPEELNKLIHSLAKEHNVPVVPMKSYFEGNSKNRLIGNELMLEHLHPNKKGYFLMADAFFDVLKENKFIEDTWDANKIKLSSYYENNWGFSPIDSIYASITIKQLKCGWPFKLDVTLNNFLDTFTASNMMERSIIQIFKNSDMTLEKAHIQVAKYYEAEGNLNLAYKEYKALIYTVPYFDLFYEPAVKLLVYQERYSEALKLLNELSIYQENRFTYKWIGQIYLALGDPAKAIPYLEKLLQVNDRDELLLHNLCLAYFSTGEIKNGERIFDLLKYNFPKSRFISHLEKLKKKL